MSDYTSAGHFACTADRIFDGCKVYADCAVVVDGGTVSALVPITDLPADLPVIDFPGCTIIPGLIDAHIHFMRWQGPAYLAYGVTTVRDTGNELNWILDRRHEAEGRSWPRILTLGPILDGPDPIHEIVSRRCCNSTDAVDAVRETLDAGADGIKLYVGLPASWLPAMVDHCHERGFKASMHCGSHGLRAAMHSGVDEFFHHDGILADIWPDGKPPGWLDTWGDHEMIATWDRQQHLADEIRKAGITATPTLAYWYSQWCTRTPEGYSEEESALVPYLIAERQSPPRDQTTADKWRRALDAALCFTGLLIEREVSVLAGTDVPCGTVPPGLSLWQEICFLNEAGLSPLKALRAASADTATFMRRPELGRLNPGAAADLVVVRGNPLDVIPHHPDIVHVMRRGIFYDRQELLLQARTPLGRGIREAGFDPEAPDPWAMRFKSLATG